MRQRKPKLSQTIVHETPPTTFEKPVEDETNKRKLQSYQRKQELISMADQLAGSPVHEKNWKYNEAAKLFPAHPRLRCVDKRYPYATGGPLLVDEPKDKQELQAAKTKAACLRKLGYRYVIIEATSSIDDCLAQLAEKKLA